MKQSIRLWLVLLCAIAFTSCGVMELVFSNTPDEFGRGNPFDPDGEDYGGVITEDTDGDGIGDYLDADEIIQVSPGNGSTIGDITPELRIRAKSSEVVSGYVFQLSTDTSLTELLLDVTDGLWNTTVVPLDVLENGNTYYWRGGVAAADGEEYWGEVWSFTLDVTQTESSGVTPEDNGVTNDTTPLLSWQQTAGAERYGVQIAGDAGFTEIVEDGETAGAESEYQVAGILANGRTYYWRVRAAVDGEWQEWSEVYTFTVDISAVQLTAPEDNAVVVSMTPTFSWEANPMAVRYHLVVDDDWAFSSPVIDDESITTTEYTSAVALEHDYSYYWKAAAIDADHVQGTFSMTRGLTVNRYHVALLSPENGSTAAISVRTFSWASNANADSYRLMIADDAGFTNPIVDAETTETSYTLSGAGSEVLEADITYYWRVKINYPVFEDASWSSVWSITVDSWSDEGLLAYYPFTGDAADYSGNSHDGVVKNGASLVVGRFGAADSAYSFDGIDDRIEVDSGFLRSLSAGTVSLFIRPDVIDEENWFLCYGLDSAVGLSLAITNRSPPGNRICYQWCNSVITRAGQEDAVLEGQWYHVALTWEDGLMRTYLDAIVDEELVGASNLGDVDQPLLFGADSFFRDAHSFNGSLDDIRIYNRVLSSEELQALSDDR